MKFHQYLLPDVPEARGTLPDELLHAIAFDLYKAPRLKYLWGLQVQGCLLNLGQGQGKETSGVFPVLTVEIKQVLSGTTESAYWHWARTANHPEKTRAQT